MLRHVNSKLIWKRALKLIARHAATRELKVNLESTNPGILMQD